MSPKSSNTSLPLDNDTNATGWVSIATDSSYGDCRAQIRDIFT